MEEGIREVVITLVELPLVLPPTVAGIGLLAAFAGRLHYVRTDVTQPGGIAPAKGRLIIGIGINGTDCIAEFEKPAKTGFYLKLRDDPAAANSVTLPILPQQVPTDR